LIDVVLFVSRRVSFLGSFAKRGSSVELELFSMSSIDQALDTWKISGWLPGKRQRGCGTSRQAYDVRCLAGTTPESLKNLTIQNDGEHRGKRPHISV